MPDRSIFGSHTIMAAASEALHLSHGLSHGSGSHAGLNLDDLNDRSLFVIIFISRTAFIPTVLSVKLKHVCARACG